MDGGFVNFRCPKVETRKDYIVVCESYLRFGRFSSFVTDPYFSVIGDSGSRSPPFTIKK